MAVPKSMPAHMRGSNHVPVRISEAAAVALAFLQTSNPWATYLGPGWFTLRRWHATVLFREALAGADPDRKCPMPRGQRYALRRLAEQIEAKL